MSYNCVQKISYETTQKILKKKYNVRDSLTLIIPVEVKYH